MLAAEEDALRVHVLDALPDLDGCVDDGGVVAGRDAGVVVEDVDSAESLRRGPHHPRHLALVGHVHPDGERRALGAETDRLLGCREIHVGDADTRAFGGEDLRGDAAHPAAGAGDHARLPVEAAHQARASR